MSDGDDKYWYNTKTREVEHGMLSPAPERVGPFDTAAEAERAPEIIQERARAWAEEERREDSWGIDDAVDGFEG
ncbi:SPOR domain-containing protein [Microbacterium terrisoli]|uniref:SPOR domain-containing protein n=1 Tax=Microbacterium terrisoli TaxID=3242192 RepID=UPI0028048478|nr:SPOR domain-containing protein [Microbacterium protaetiae]